MQARRPRRAAFALASPREARGLVRPRAAPRVPPHARAGFLVRSAPPGGGRLEDLTLYDLELALEIDPGTFHVGEEIWFTNTTGGPLDEVVLRIYANAHGAGGGGGAAPKVSFAKAACGGPGISPVDCSVTQEGASTLVARPKSMLPAGGRLRIALSLEGTLEVIDSARTNLLAQGMEGLSSIGGSEGAHDYGILAKGDGIASIGNFFAVVAPRRDGAWERGGTSPAPDDGDVGDVGSDELANVRAHIEVDDGVHVATSGVVTKDDVKAGKREIDVAAGLVRDFAVVAGKDVQSATVFVGDVEVRSHFLGEERAAGLKVLDAAKASLEDFEKRFGRYPYADLDVVEAPLVGGAGGVEFAGLTTIASMFYRPAMAGGGALGSVLGALGKKAKGGGDPLAGMIEGMREFVTAHEVAHQFWHGLVGSDSRLHPFLDEGLAQYSAILYLEDRYGKERAKKDGDLNVAMNYRAMRMMGHEDGVVDRPASAFGGMIPYAGLVYGKGPYVWRALRESVGDAAFFDALRAYATKYAWTIAPPRALVDFLAASPKGVKVRAIAKRWLEEAHGDEDVGKGNLLDMMGSAFGGSGLPKAGDVDMKEVMDTPPERHERRRPRAASPAGNRLPEARRGHEEPPRGARGRRHRGRLGGRRGSRARLRASARRRRGAGHRPGRPPHRE